jgi:L-asparagine transporter-like permease
MIDYVICVIFVSNLFRMIHEYVLSRNEAGSFPEVSNLHGMIYTWRMINS